MDSSLGLEEDLLSSQVQGVFQTFGNGWSVNVDLIRVPALDYPKTHYFNNPTSVLIEKSRCLEYERQGEHFENIYTISFCYLPSVVDNKTMNNFLVKNAPQEETTSLDFIIGIFNQKLAEFQGNIANKIRIKRMSSAEMMTFLNRCICGEKHQVPVPQPPCYLNHYLGAHEFIGGHELMIDDHYIGVITLTQFPYESYSGILNILSTLPFEYRFSSRFLFYDPIDALGIVSEYQGKYIGMKYSIGQMVMGALGKDPRSSPDAANRSVLTKIEETKTAQEAIELGQVNYGYATFVVVVLNNNKEDCKRKVEFIRDLLNNNWFPSIIERMNSIEAYLGSLPGETLKNIRKPFISTQNLANMLPLTDVWSGFEYNPCPYYPKNSPPLFYAATNGTTPFRFNVHVGDVGHTLILGPTGAGKSVLLSHIANSALRYEGAQVYIFDKGYSQYVLTQAVGGKFYDIMGDDDNLAVADCEVHRAAPNSGCLVCPIGKSMRAAIPEVVCRWSCVRNGPPCQPRAIVLLILHSSAQFDSWPRHRLSDELGISSDGLLVVMWLFYGVVGRPRYIVWCKGHLSVHALRRLVKDAQDLGHRVERKSACEHGDCSASAGTICAALCIGECIYACSGHHIVPVEAAVGDSCDSGAQPIYIRGKVSS